MTRCSYSMETLLTYRYLTGLSSKSKWCWGRIWIHKYCMCKSHWLCRTVCVSCQVMCYIILKTLEHFWFQTKSCCYCSEGKLRRLKCHAFAYLAFLPDIDHWVRKWVCHIPWNHTKPTVSFPDGVTPAERHCLSCSWYHYYTVGDYRGICVNDLPRIVA